MENYRKHVLYSWLLAQAIHLFLFRLTVLRGDQFSIGTDVEWAFVALFFTLPALLLCFLFIRAIVQLNTKPVLRLVIWIGVAVLSILFSVFLIFLGLGGIDAFPQAVIFLVPGGLSAAFSILLRYKQFFQLINQTTKHANNLV